MGLNTIGGTGIPLQTPSQLYPTPASGLPNLSPTNRLSLAPGADILIPAGTWNITLGLYTVLQVLDPVTNTWGAIATADPFSRISISTDGTNYRLLNPLGFPVGAIITAGGTGFTSAPVVSAASGGSTWLAQVGGAIGSLNITTILSSAGLLALSGGSGANYATPPNIHIAAPPSPGIPATAVCTISGGALASFQIINPGAGYTSPPAVTVVAQPTDLNFTGNVAGVRNAGVTASLSGVGQITGLYLLNEGNVPLTVPPQLTFAGGAGSGATATVIIPNTVLNYTVTTGGSGYSITPAIMAAGGNITTLSSGVGGQTNNPSMSNFLVLPRQAQILGLLSGAAVSVVQTPNSGISDGGVYTAPPTAIVLSNTVNFSANGTTAVVTLNMGQVSDTVFITPA